MATILSSRNAARYGADVCADSYDGICGGRSVCLTGAEQLSKARKAARRRVKHAERAAWRAEVAAEVAEETATDLEVARAIARYLDVAGDPHEYGGTLWADGSAGWYGGAEWADADKFGRDAEGRYVSAARRVVIASRAHYSHGRAWLTAPAGY